MTNQQNENGASQERSSAIEKLSAAILHAVDKAPVEDVLSVLAGAFVSLTVEVLRQQGHDVSQRIEISGGDGRDITIHAPKSPVKG